jgi:hypothetical protein
VNWVIKPAERHFIAENLTDPCVEDAVQRAFGENAGKELNFYHC